MRTNTVNKCSFQCFYLPHNRLRSKFFFASSKFFIDILLERKKIQVFKWMIVRFNGLMRQHVKIGKLPAFCFEAVFYRENLLQLLELLRQPVDLSNFDLPFDEILKTSCNQIGELHPLDYSSQTISLFWRRQKFNSITFSPDPILIVKKDVINIAPERVMWITLSFYGQLNPFNLPWLFNTWVRLVRNICYNHFLSFILSVSLLQFLQVFQKFFWTLSIVLPTFSRNKKHCLWKLSNSNCKF